MAIPANMEKVLVDKVKATFRDAVVETSVFKNEVTHVVEKRALKSVCTFFKTDPETKMNFLSDVVGVDYLPRRPRFEVVYHMYSTLYKFRVRVKVRVDEGETIDSVTNIWAGADWAEREVYDMFGIVFDGHPNMKRIYLADDWEGYPLRKDYPLKGYKDRYNPFGVEKK